ncbi:MAG TPA: hypothetical protein VHO50_13495 [Bacteroidales bacterium]|nr:hypothetical protein [Bacteroidales bacterium]
MKKLDDSMAGKGKFELLLSQISDEDVLSVYEMVCIRGGEGEPTPPIKPPEN